MAATAPDTTGLVPPIGPLGCMGCGCQGCRHLCVGAWAVRRALGVQLEKRPRFRIGWDSRQISMSEMPGDSEGGPGNGHRRMLCWDQG